jgi:hypothetical protein
MLTLKFSDRFLCGLALADSQSVFPAGNISIPVGQTGIGGARCIHVYSNEYPWFWAIFFTTDNILAHSPHNPLGQHLSSLGRSHARIWSIRRCERIYTHTDTLNDRAAGGGGNPRRLGEAAPRRQTASGGRVSQSGVRSQRSRPAAPRRFSRAQSRRRPAAHRTRSDRARDVQRSRRSGNLQTSSLNFLLFFSLQPHLHIIVALAQI